MAPSFYARLLLVLLLAPGTAPGLDLRAQTEPLAAPLVKDGNAVGLVVGFYRRGDTQVLAFGEVEKGSGVAPDGDTVYEIGSVTKVFTGILLAERVLEGSMDIDAPLQRYLPDGLKVPVLEGRPILLRHLATHTSGLGRDPEFMRSPDRLNPYAHLSLDELYASLTAYGPRRAPGRFAYSNFGIGLLGHVIALQAKAGYEEVLIARICAPLAMHDTRPRPHPAMLARLAPPYDASHVRVKNYDLPVLAGAGGIRSSPHDMLKFIRANLADDEATPVGRAIKLSHRKLHTREDGRGNAYGWQVSRSGQILYHAGSTGGYRAFLGIVPAQKAGVVVLSNTAAAGIHELGDRLLPVVVRGEAGRL